MIRHGDCGAANHGHRRSSSTLRSAPRTPYTRKPGGLKGSPMGSSHVNTFTGLGGVPKAVVCDNLKARVTNAIPRVTLSLTYWHDIGVREIVALKEKRFTRDLRKRIGKAIAEIQLCRMAAA